MAIRNCGKCSWQEKQAVETREPGGSKETVAIYNTKYPAPVRAGERRKMSSKLKKKKMDPAGYSRKTLKKMQDTARKANNTEEFFRETIKNIKLISYQILHDKFGFGQKRLVKLEKAMEDSVDVSKGEAIKEMQEVLLKKYGIDTKEEANRVPFRERLYLVRCRIDAGSRASAGLWILDIISCYFGILGYCLKTEFKFSANQIRKAYRHIRDYINTLSRPKQFELTIDMIAECLMEEVKYCDSRFAGGMPV